MSKYIDTLFDAAPPTGEVGSPFVANQGPNTIPPKGAFLDHLQISIMGDISTSAIAVETFLLALSQFTVKAGQETRIQLNGIDLVALMASFYKELPRVGADSGTGNNYVFGIKVPIQETMSNNITYTWSATYAAQTNTTNVRLSVRAVYLSDSHGRKPVIAVPTSFTTPGSTGVTSLGATYQNLGDMVGILMYQTTVFGNASDVYDVQRVQISENGKQTSLLSAADASNILGQFSFAIADPTGELLAQYCYFDFVDEPLDANQGFVQLSLDVETVSEAIRVIPIILKK